jgi:hypothetical protein
LGPCCYDVRQLCIKLAAAVAAELLAWLLHLLSGA